MKTTIKSLSLVTGILVTTAFIMLCTTAKADLANQSATAYSSSSSWATDPGGNNPFYSTANLAVPGNFSNHGAPGAAAGATGSLLAETVTITNGAGNIGLSSSLTPNTNYVLTGISVLISGYDSTHPLSLHIFDVTTNLTGGLLSSTATYDFTANGDLLGGGNGLLWTNAQLSGAEQQVYLGLQNGPATEDQIVLASNHTYAVEIWVSTSVGSFYWYKSSAAPQDIGGWFMAGNDTRLTVARLAANSSTFGFTGSSDHTWAIALYGHPTSATPTVNTNLTATTNYIIDSFNSYGYGPTNRYVGTNNYSLGGITNIWSNWFGSAFSNLVWDSSSDAAGNTPNSGSMKITADFSNGGQFVVFDGFNGITPALSALTNGLTSFQCDVRFDPSSPTTVNSGTAVTNYGHLQFGIEVAGGGQDFFTPAYEIAVGTTNWVHVTCPLSIITDPNLLVIPDVLIKIDGGWYGSHPLNGPSTLWVDNIKFVGPAAVVLPPAPKVSIQKAVPGVRMFAGSTQNTYDRVELATVDQNQSWVNGSFPVSYSFTLLTYPANINQTMIFLVPTATAGGNAMYNNEYIEYQDANALWLDIQPWGAGGATATVEWKTNLPNSNPNQTALYFTNATAVGTWTLQFTDNNHGKVFAPGAPNGVNFTITNNTVATDFGNTLVAYFGLQPNSSSGEGQYEDWASISVTGVAGLNENDNFTTDATLSSIWSINTIDTAHQIDVQLVPATTACWVNWTTPAINYDLGTANNLLAPISVNSAPNGWVLPWYYDDYYTQTEALMGNLMWVMIPSDCLPTVDGSQYGTPAPNAFFQLFSPPLVN